MRGSTVCQYGSAAAFLMVGMRPPPVLFWTFWNSSSERNLASSKDASGFFTPVGSTLANPPDQVWDLATPAAGGCGQTIQSRSFSANMPISWLVELITALSVPALSMSIVPVLGCAARNASTPAYPPNSLVLAISQSSAAMFLGWSIVTRLALASYQSPPCSQPQPKRRQLFQLPHGTKPSRSKAPGRPMVSWRMILSKSSSVLGAVRGMPAFFKWAAFT